MAVTDGRDDDASTELSSTGQASDNGGAPPNGARAAAPPETAPAVSDAAAGDTTNAHEGAAHATRGRTGRIVLREVDPADAAGDPPPVRESSAVTTSLLAAFTERPDGATRLPATTTAASGPTGRASVDGTAPTPGDATPDDSADDATADTPTEVTADTADTPTEVTADTADTPTELTADIDEVTADRPAGADAQSAPAAAVSGAAADSGVGRFANLPTVPMASVDTAVDQPTDRATADDTARTSADEDQPDSRDDGRHTGSALPSVDPWTTVSQVTLLSIGVLAVIQTVVLVIVNQFLVQSANGVGRETADVLAAHGKVTTVMLPALVGGAAAAIALAVWRIRAGMPATTGDLERPGTRVFGVPVPLWITAAATVGVLVVVLAASSASIAAAQRTTIAAITTCVALAAAFLFAPRSLAVPAGEDATDDDAATDPSASPGPLVGVG